MATPSVDDKITTSTAQNSKHGIQNVDTEIQNKAFNAVAPPTAQLPDNVDLPLKLQSAGIARSITLPEPKDMMFCFVCMQEANLVHGMLFKCCRCSYIHGRCMMRYFKNYRVSQCETCKQQYSIPIDAISPVFGKFFMRVNYARYVSPITTLITCMLLLTILILLILACSKLTECIEASEELDPTLLCPNLLERNIYWNGVGSCIAFMSLFLFVGFFIVRRCSCCGMIPNYLQK